MADSLWFVLRNALAGDTQGGGSPDVILGGPTPDPRYAEEYGTAFNATGNFAGSNYVYVRARNAGTTQAIGNVSVFAARTGSLHNQSQWVALQTEDMRPSTTIWAPAGEVGLSGAPLVWEPTQAPAPGAPWCLIAQIAGDGHPPVTVPDAVTDRASFDAWVAGEPRLAYVIVQAPEAAPVDTPIFGWSRKVNLGNADATTLHVSVTCTKGPAGGFLSYSFDRNDNSGQAIGIGNTAYQVNTVYSQTRTVSAGFASTVSLAYTPPGDGDDDAEFALQVATESDRGGGGRELGTATVSVVATYTLRFGQARSDA